MVKEEKKWLVYKHTSPSGKSYIGITCKKPEERWGKNGRCYLYQNNKKFAYAIKKYGWNNFNHEILEYDLSDIEAKEKEQAYIEKYNSYANGYNSTLGGDGGGFIGGHHSKESKEKISRAFKGRFVGELNPMYGIHNNHISVNGKLPKSICKKISDKAKSNKDNIERLKEFNEDRKISVNQYDLIGNLINTYDSLTMASEITNVCLTSIWKCCQRRKDSLSGGGFQWRYSDDCEDIGEYTKKIPTKRYGKENHNSININQYDLLGKYIKTWNSVSDAARYYNINSSTISGALNEDKHKNAKNFQWRRYNNSKCEDIKPYIKNTDYSYCSKIIYQYDLLGNYITEYNSGKEASVITGINTSSICGCCNGKQKMAGGYIWKYKE